jgi:aspartyl-tRNA(Asn)/glutamyl-tRNA(Gln) amidotransferase subunit B
MFCRCESGFGAAPNTRTCPVCLGHPGSLPVPNAAAIEWTIKLGLALDCEIAERALFHRKQYFYPDNAKNYQISQYDIPLCTNGRFLVPGPDGDREVGIVRAHLEEDAAKNVHVGGAGGRIGGAAHTLVDYNRGGTPLVEIVTQPDIHAADEAKRFLQLLRQTVVELGISDAEMEKGTLRADANVSVRPRGSDELRTRTEIKNMNSFTFIARGIEAEVERQIAVWEAGEAVIQQTFDFDPDTGKLSPRRTKEEAEDYRYLPEPDLVPIEPAPELVERLRAELPEQPGARIRRLEPELGFELAEGLVTAGRDRLYERTPGDRRAVANVVMNQLAATGVDPEAVDGEELGKLIEARERIPRPAFIEALAHAGDGDFRAERYLEEAAVADVSELGPLIEEVLAAHPEEVKAYRGGKQGLLGFFVGQVMQKTDGKADAKVVNQLLREKLGA